jgi:hypothetical protein
LRRIGEDGETLKITDEDQGETRVRLIEISEVALFGNESITTPALSAPLERENTSPTPSPVNASRLPCGQPVHHSGPVRFATPSL